MVFHSFSIIHCHRYTLVRLTFNPTDIGFEWTRDETLLVHTGDHATKILMKAATVVLKGEMNQALTIAILLKDPIPAVSVSVYICTGKSVSCSI